MQVRDQEKYWNSYIASHTATAIKAELKRDTLLAEVHQPPTDIVLPEMLRAAGRRLSHSSTWTAAFTLGGSVLKAGILLKNRFQTWGSPDCASSRQGKDEDAFQFSPDESFAQYLSCDATPCSTRGLKTPCSPYGHHPNPLANGRAFPWSILQLFPHRFVKSAFPTWFASTKLPAWDQLIMRLKFWLLKPKQKEKKKKKVEFQ